MMNKVDLAVLPVLNVDGYVYSWTKVGEKFSLFYIHITSKIEGSRKRDD